MTPERWQAVKEVLESALDRVPEERPAFVEQACAGDEELRREVESLIASLEKTGSFIDVPPFEAAAQLLAEEKLELTPGHRIGHYKILSLLGSGGMGEVYLAQDEKLGRQIALKLLPIYLSEDEDRLRRFEQEARAASALNHPNVCVIHEVGETAGGRDYIAMEYIEGVTLRQHMTGARLKLSEVLEVAVQVASGLGAAHEVGVMHRDIKPENIMLRRDGYVKVLDFGLAKLTEQPTTDVTMRAGARAKTDTGAIMGTSSYMSPEQARGLSVDGRTDIWSLGVVIYEMVTGEAPFEGETTSDVIVSILEREPQPLEHFLPEAPAELQRIITKTLHKEREGRYQTSKGLAIDLKSLKQDLELKAKLEYSSQPGSSGRRRFRTSALAVASTLIVVGAVWFYFSPHPTGTSSHVVSDSLLPPMTSLPFTSLPGSELFPAFSPDGKEIAFAWDGGKDGNTNIYVKLIDAGAPLRLTSHPDSDVSPAWSPDGRYVAFARYVGSESGIFIVPALGGTERKLYSPDWNSLMAARVAWSPDGKNLAFADRDSPHEPYCIFLLSVETLEKRKLTSSPPQYLGDSRPSFSPDGQTLSFTRMSSTDVGELYLVSVGGGEPKQLTFDNAGVFSSVWTADGGSIVFSSSRGGSSFTLWRISASGGMLEPLRGIGEHAVHPSISRQGNRLAYSSDVLDINIWRIELSDSTGQASSPTKLIASTRQETGPQFSPDGKRIVFDSDRSGFNEIWVCDANGANQLQLTNFGGPLVPRGTARWSPDGRRIAFDSRAEGHSDIYVINAEGGKPRRLTTGISDDMVPSWSRDGRWIYFASNRSGMRQVWKVAADGGEAMQVTKAGGFAAFESTDGKFIFYAKFDAPGLWRIPVDGGEEKLILDKLQPGLWGYWAVADKGIYFVNASAKPHPAIEFFSFAAQQVTRVALMEKDPALGNPGLAVSLDGRHILYAQVDQSGSDIMLVQNFH